jgi:hypothetical protein
MKSINKIQAGKYRVVATGSVLTFPKKPLTISIYSGTSKELSIEFVFKFAEKKEPTIFFNDEPDNNRLKVLLTNFDDPMGGGTAGPEPIASSDDEKLYLHFRVAGSSDRDLQELTYTIFSEPIKEKTNVSSKKKRK